MGHGQTSRWSTSAMGLPGCGLVGALAGWAMGWPGNEMAGNGQARPWPGLMWAGPDVSWPSHGLYKAWAGRAMD
jgi:hypothetical protein